jgi:hypothetical protein
VPNTLIIFWPLHFQIFYTSNPRMLCPVLLRVVGCLPSGQDRRGTAYCAGRRRTSLEGGNRGMLPCGWHRGYRYGVCRREAGLNAAIWQALRTAMSCRCLAKAWWRRIFGGSAQQESPGLRRKAKPFALRDGGHGTDAQFGVEAIPWVMLALVMAVARGSVGGAGTSR